MTYDHNRHSQPNRNPKFTFWFLWALVTILIAGVFVYSVANLTPTLKKSMSHKASSAAWRSPGSCHRTS
jgi:hypothetical protein